MDVTSIKTIQVEKLGELAAFVVTGAAQLANTPISRESRMLKGETSWFMPTNYIMRKEDEELRNKNIDKEPHKCQKRITKVYQILIEMTLKAKKRS